MTVNMVHVSSYMVVNISTQNSDEKYFQMQIRAVKADMICYIKRPVVKR